MKRRLTRKQLQTLAERWQQDLRLPHWKLTTKWLKPNPDGELNQGEIWWDTEELIAEMKVDQDGPDIEGTVVHELLHLWFDAIHGEYRGHSIANEQAINAITGALVSRKRYLRGRSPKV